MRVEQANNKAITTPSDNAEIGRYFRSRLGLHEGEKSQGSISRNTAERMLHLPSWMMSIFCWISQLIVQKWKNNKKEWHGHSFLL